MGYEDISPLGRYLLGLGIEPERNYVHMISKKETAPHTLFFSVVDQESGIDTGCMIEIHEISKDSVSISIFPGEQNLLPRRFLKGGVNFQEEIAERLAIKSGNGKDLSLPELEEIIGF